jgi:hypothetical protein
MKQIKKEEIILKGGTDKKESVSIRCSCGAKINGTTLEHAKALLKMHKLSKRHKDFMEYQSSGALLIKTETKKGGVTNQE